MANSYLMGGKDHITLIFYRTEREREREGRKEEMGFNFKLAQFIKSYLS